MKKFKAILGVTLLEIMLVLAIASMIIVMSIRYYQSATVSQQVNVATQEILAITAAMDNLATGAQSYVGIDTAKLTAVVGAANMVSPTNGAVTITGSPTATTYRIRMELNPAICASVAAKLVANQRLTNPACNNNGVLTYTYNSTM